MSSKKNKLWKWAQLNGSPVNNITWADMDVCGICKEPLDSGKVRIGIFTDLNYVTIKGEGYKCIPLCVKHHCVLHKFIPLLGRAIYIKKGNVTYGIDIDKFTEKYLSFYGNVTCTKQLMLNSKVYVKNITQTRGNIALEIDNVENIKPTKESSSKGSNHKSIAKTTTTTTASATTKKFTKTKTVFNIYPDTAFFPEQGVAK